MITDKNKILQNNVWAVMFFAYLFSMAVRMIWVWQFQDNPSFYWNGQLMINTNDGYTWAAGAQAVLYDMHGTNPGIRSIWENGIIFFTALFTKITPFSFETILLFMPAVISSLVVIPIILITRLYDQTLWGFFAALLGSIAWSYYNRTMVGYYDTDMFSAMAPMFILYFLMKSTMDFTLRSALYAALAIAIYPFLYDQGRAIIYAMGTLYALYMIFYHRNDNTTYLSLVLVFIALLPFPLEAPYSYIVKILFLIGLYFVLNRFSFEQKKLMAISGILFLMFMYFGNVFGLILSKVMGYLVTGTETEGLHFYSVIQTVREAGKIPFETFANRISGSPIGLMTAIIGYIVLVVRHRAFILALPLVGIGAFALWGGLRFTVYAVPIAALGSIYLFFAVGSYFKDKRVKYLFITFATFAMLYPNVKHILAYKVPTVMTSAEVKDLNTLNQISKPTDYTLAWWDYGYPIWFYSETSTIIDGGKHNNDNFIVSTIMQTDSSELAANLGRLAVETYVQSGYQIIADTLFKNKRKDQLDPDILLSELEASSYALPSKTRDIYLYLPFRMMRIFPTVAVFGNLDLNTGKALRKIVFSPLKIVKQDQGNLIFSNGIRFDSVKGELHLGKEKSLLKNVTVVETTAKGNKIKELYRHHMSGEYVLVFMKNYNQFILMDRKTYDSMYVQMFILGEYDKELFELVISSPYSKIYRLKK